MITTLEQARAFRAKIERAAAYLTDEKALESIELFPLWNVGISYKKGDRVRYDNKLYKSLVDHESAENYTPDITNYQWVEVADPSIEYPDWVQPLGYADAYASGAKVTHNSKHWVSTIDSNVWEPGVYGWDEVNA